MHRHELPTRATVRSTALLVLATLALTIVLTRSAEAGSDPLAVAAAAATQARVAADQHLDEVTAARDALIAEHSDLDAASKELVRRVTEARSDLRAVTLRSFTHPEDPLAGIDMVFGGDTFVASQRQHLPKAVADHKAELVDEYERLRASVSPRLLAVATELEQAERDLFEATNSAFAARATEAEAERQIALRDAQVAERKRQARLAAARKAAATTTTTQATAPTETAPTGPVPTGAQPGEAAPTTTAAAKPAPTTTAAPAQGSGPTEAQWAALRKCESGGNYRAINPSGRYRGAYQFDYRTWNALGPAGDPAAAPPEEQDRRAKALYAMRGARPWPECGRFLR
jgi:peptidoglycan hydrolase CwlO-like protein